jgi:hypothetical protein
MAIALGEPLADRNCRILQVTAGNLRQHHLYIREHLDFFPADCIGPAKQSKNGSPDNQIEIVLDGLNQTVRTDIGTDAKTGKSRGFFRGRRWVGAFFKHHGIAAGDRLALERLRERRYRLLRLSEAALDSFAK